MDGFFALKGNSKDQKKEYLQKLQEGRDKLKRERNQGSSVATLQKYLKGCHSRLTYRKQLEADLRKNLGDLDKLAQVLLVQKNQTLRLPLDKVVYLINCLRMVKRLRQGMRVKAPNAAATRGMTVAEKAKAALAAKHPFAEETIGLAKWLDRGLDSPQHSFIEQLDFTKTYCQTNLKSDSQELQKAHKTMSNDFYSESENLFFVLSKRQDARVKSVLYLIAEVFRSLPMDTRSGNLMQFLCNVMAAKLKIADRAKQESIDVALGHMNLDLNFMGAVRDWLYPKRLEIHQLFHEISNERKRYVNIAVKLATQLFSEFKASNQTNYDLAINLQFNYVNEILSLPTITKYLIPMLEQAQEPLKINFKLLYQSFYFSKLINLDEEESKQAQQEAVGNAIPETQKSERKMFIFSNTFELLLTNLIYKVDVFELYPALQCLEVTVHHLTRSIFDQTRSVVDEYILTLILRRQLQTILDFKTTSKLFGTIFGERVDKKHSIFEDTFNPQAAIAITKVYSNILLISRQSPEVFQKITLGLAFNEPVLYKLWKFIEVYCGIESLLVRDYGQYQSFIHTCVLFFIAFKANLWVSSFEEFLKNQYFDRNDVLSLVQLLKPLIINLIQGMKQQAGGKLSLLDEFVVVTASPLLRMLHEYFAIKDYLDPSEWDIQGINWQKALQGDNASISNDVRLIMRYMPECIPFEIRALFFTKHVDVERHRSRQISHVVQIKRSAIFDDGYRELSKIQNLREHVKVIFVNAMGVAEEGSDAGGLFKEFLTNLIEIVFNPNYGLFILTPTENELYPNPASEMLFGPNHLHFYRFLGRILGKAVFDGITVEPTFANFFVKKLISKSNSLNDLKSLDFELYKHLNSLRDFDGDIGDLELYFRVTDENSVTGQLQEIDLVPNGENVKVTNHNKFRYIYMVADHRLNQRIKPQSDAFVNGFRECIPMSWLGIFNDRELNMLMSGASKSFDVRDLIKHTVYKNGFSSSSKQVKWFWKFVEKEMSDDDRSKMLKFVTSCPRAPLMGFGSLQPSFTVVKMDCQQPDTKLPTSSTCFNLIRIPPYSSERVLKDKIMYAIHSNAGFEMA